METERSTAGDKMKTPWSSRVFTACLIAAMAGGAVLATAAAAASPAACPVNSPMVQILGSGGPLVGGTRASTAYLVWRDGRAIAMIDAGGGAFLRFGEAGAHLRDLAFLGISHLHPDHVA